MVYPAAFHADFAAALAAGVIVARRGMPWAAAGLAATWREPRLDVSRALPWRLPWTRAAACVAKKSNNVILHTYCTGSILMIDMGGAV